MIPEISARTLQDRFDRGEPLVLLDVREDDERTYCWIPAPENVIDLHIPMSRLAQCVREIPSAGPIPFVVYCHHGVRSLIAARWLHAQGILHVENLDGGIDAWSTEVDPSIPRY